MKEYIVYCVLFLPLLLGFVFLAHTIYAPLVLEFSTLEDSLLTLLVLLRGDIDLLGLQQVAKVWTPIFMCGFFLLFVLFLLQGFSGVMVLAEMQVAVPLSDPWRDPSHKWRSGEACEWLQPEELSSRKHAEEADAPAPHRQR